MQMSLIFFVSTLMANCNAEQWTGQPEAAQCANKSELARAAHLTIGRCICFCIKKHFLTGLCQRVLPQIPNPYGIWTCCGAFVTFYPEYGLTVYTNGDGKPLDADFDDR
jgi:hypothetical protein